METSTYIAIIVVDHYNSLMIHVKRERISAQVCIIFGLFSNIDFRQVLPSLVLITIIRW